jgi:hypothetical protein
MHGRYRFHDDDEPRGARLKGPDGHWVGAMHKRSPEVKRGDLFRQNRTEDRERENRAIGVAATVADYMDERVTR